MVRTRRPEERGMVRTRRAGGRGMVRTRREGGRAGEAGRGKPPRQ